MCLNTTDTSVGLVTNATDCGRNLDPVVLEFKIMNCVMASIAFCILIVSGIICSLSYIRRRSVFARPGSDLSSAEPAVFGGCGSGCDSP
ncbi:uncharacterized protein LOC144600925 isoform X3 [Rhinoraja longicauda]